METINGQIIYKYPLDTYLKYKPNLNIVDIPNELRPYIMNNNINQGSNSDFTSRGPIYDLSYPQIRAYLSTYMNKKHNNETDDIFSKKIQNLLNKVSKDNII